MNEAAHYKRLPDNVVECRLCPHRCRIGEGRRGICAVRENRSGTLVSLVYGMLAAAHPDPVEKKPLFHFYPGSSAFSVATVGCNLSCPFCQNHTLSVACRKGTAIPGSRIKPEKVVREACDYGARTLCFTYSEPTVFYEYMLEMAVLAREAGLSTAVVSNGFIELEPLEALIPFLDAANIDLKAFSDQTYRRVLGGRLDPVLDTIRALYHGGVWVEVTTLVVPELNDSDGEIEAIAEFLAGLGDSIPWHVSRFHPDYRMTDRPATGAESLEQALAAGRLSGLKYVYGGNLPGLGENTICPGCGTEVIERFGFRVTRTRLEPGGLCSKCGHRLDGRFD